MADTDLIRAINALKKTDIDSVLAEWDQIGRDKFLEKHKVNRAAKFKIKVKEDEYDAKAVLVVALRNSNILLKGLQSVTVESNEKTIATPLRELGFEVVEVNEAQLVGDDKVAIEVRGFLSQYDSRLGKVWQLNEQGKTHREIADDMGVATDGYVGKLLRFATAIEGGNLPTARTMVIECSREFKSLLEKFESDMTPRTREALKARHRELRSRIKGSLELEPLLQEVLDLNKSYINDNADPKMRRRAELLRGELTKAVKSIVNDPSSRSSWKVKSESFVKDSVLEVPYIFSADSAVAARAPKKGIFFVILFAKDGSCIYLSLNQGVTTDSNLTTTEMVVNNRRTLSRHVGDATFNPINLLDSTVVGRNFENGNIASIRYTDGNIPSEEQIFDDLTHMLELQQMLYSETRKGEPMNIELQRLVSSFDDAVEGAHLIFKNENDVLPAVFVRGLLAKRFCILGGSAGSGKTQIAKAFGKWLGKTEEGDQRYLIVPVRADWTSPDPLLGFEDALGKTAEDGRKSWSIPDPCKFMLRAAREPDRLWLLVLDEMNIAHVERYFSDVLSGIESGEPVLPNVSLEQDNNLRIKPGDAEKIPLPSNLVIVGTVNIDETTYQFSPKVLDRSFTFEFRVQTDELSSNALRPEAPAPASPNQLQLLRDIACDDEWHLAHISSINEIYTQVKEVHAILSKHNFEFGHRSMYEILRFAVICQQSGFESEKILDWSIMTKILPRIHGSAQQLYSLLEELQSYATNHDLKLTLKKVNRMNDLVRANGFASFAE